MGALAIKPKAKDSIAPLWSWLLLYVAVRFIVLAFIRPAQMFPYSTEELYQGTIGKLLIDRLGFPLLSYRPNDYLGGPLVVGVMASLFFRLLGPTAIALKLVPLTIFGAALAVWHLMLKRFFSPRVAAIFSLLYIFSPPNFTMYTISAMGFHPETILFTGLTLWLLLLLLSDGRKAHLYIPAIGLTAGFATWFSYYYALTLAACAVYWLWSERRVPSKREAGLFCAGFLVGFTPWLVSNIGPGSIRGWMIYDLSVWQIFDPTAPYHSFSLFLLAGSFGAENGPDFAKKATDISYTASLALILIVGGVHSFRAIKWRKPRPEFLIAIYLLIFFVAVEASLRQAPRYNIPGFPFLFVLVALAIESFEHERSGILKKISPFLTPCLIALSPLFTIPLLSTRHIGEIFSMKGYAYGGAPYPLCLRTDTCRDYLAALLPRATHEERFQAAASAAASMENDIATAYPYGAMPPQLRALASTQIPLVRHQLFYAFGEDLNGYRKWALPKAMPRLVPSERDFFVWGVFNDGLGDADPTLGTYRRLLAQEPQIPPEGRECFWRAAGNRFARYWFGVDPSAARLGRSVLREFTIRRWPASRRKMFAQGVGGWLFLAWNNSGDEPTFDVGRLEELPDSLRADALFGAGMQSILDQPIEDPFVLARRRGEFLRALSPEDARAFDAGRRWVFERFEREDGAASSRLPSKMVSIK